MADRDPRTPRSEGTREKSERKKWVNPNSLIDPDPEDGIVYRWVRAEMLGAPDKANMASKLREGWEPVPASEHPKLAQFASESGHIERGGLILCRTDKEVMDERRAHYQKIANQQIASVDQSYFRENDARMPLLKPERESRVKFGKGAERD